MKQLFYIQDAVTELYLSEYGTWVPFDDETLRNWDNKDDAMFVLEANKDKLVGIYSIREFIINEP